MTEQPDGQAGDRDASADADVDAAFAELSRLPQLPVDDHVAVFDGIHQRLSDRLADAADEDASPT